MPWLLPPPHPHPFESDDMCREAMIAVADAGLAVARQSLDAEALASSPGNPIRVAGVAGTFAWLERLAAEAARPLLFHRIGTFCARKCDEPVHCIETVDAGGKVWRLLFLALGETAPCPGYPAAMRTPVAVRPAVEGQVCIGTWHFCPDFPLDLGTADGRRICDELAPGAAASHWARPEPQAARIASLLLNETARIEA